jgi:hypothetical protein
VGRAIQGGLSRALLGLIVAAVPLTGCNERPTHGTANGVKFQIAGPVASKTKVRMDGTKVFINEKYYGPALAGDIVVVSDSGAVTVNGAPRKPQSNR